MVIVFTESEVAEFKVTRAGVHLGSVNICGGSLGITHLYAENVFLVVLYLHSEGIFRQTGGTAIGPFVGTETRRTCDSVDLPHIIVVVVAGCKDQSCGKGFDLKTYLHFIVRDGSAVFILVCSTASSLYPLGLAPTGFTAESGLEVCVFSTCGSIALVVCDAHLPVVSGTRRGAESFGGYVN